MTMIADQDTKHDLWIAELADFLHREKNIEAILVNAEDKKISFATLEEVDQLALETFIQKTILEIENRIIKGKGENHTVPEGVFVTQKENDLLLKKDENEGSYLHWKWRDIPWPKRLKDHEEGEGHWKFTGLMAGLCGVAGLLGYFLTGTSSAYPWLGLVFYTFAIIAGAWEPMLAVVKKLPKGELDMHFLMLAVAFGAVSIGAWAEGALLLFLFTFAEALEEYAMSRTRSAIDGLFKLAPKMAIAVDEEGNEFEKPVDLVKPGDIIKVRPGDLFPVDGEIIEGTTSADESNITGESLPVDKGIGDETFSGTINLWGVVKTRVVRSAQKSSLQTIIQLIQEAQHLKAPSQRFTDKFGTKYTYLILSVTTFMFLFWWLVLGIAPIENTSAGYSAFYRAMTLLVVASPCALVLSIPSAILAAIAWGARHGVLFKGGAAIEKLSEINLVALDKTGTLTTGELVVNSVESFPKGREGEVLELAFALEKNSTHPIARAITMYCKKAGVAEKVINEFESLTGSGVQAAVDGAVCVLGRRELLEQGPLREWADKLPQPSEAFTEVWVIYKDLIGCILLKDKIRKESKPFLAALKKMHVFTVMLTGDRRETAEAVGREIGLQEVRYGLKPEDKVAALQEYRKQGKKIAMVGDGVNDAPSLAVADVPVAMGARGSDAALEQSEVILMNDKIESFLDAYSISIKARRIIRQNLTIALGTISLMVLAAVFGLIPLYVGVFAHEGSTAFVCLNSLRLLIARRENQKLF